MKPFLPSTTLLLLCLYEFSFAQNKTWLMLDENSKPVTINAVDQVNDTSFIIAGKAYSDDNRYGGGNFIISLMGKEGNILWSKKISGTSRYSYNGIHHGADYFILDLVQSDTGFNNVEEQVIKINLKGDVQAAMRLDGNEEFYNDARFTDLPNGNIVMLRSLLKEVQLVCFTPDLNIAWSRKILPDAGCVRNAGLAICTDKEGNIGVTGKSKNSLFICSLSASGQYLFGRKFRSDSEYFRPYQIFTASDGGGYLVMGLFTTHANRGMENSFVSRISNSGNMEWMNVLYSGTDDYELANAYSLPNGHFLLAGFSGNSNLIADMNEEGEINWTSMVEGAKYFTGSPTSINATNAITVQDEEEGTYGKVSTISFAPVTSYSTGEVCHYFQKQTSVQAYGFTYDNFNISSSSVTDYNPEVTPVNLDLENYSQKLQIQTLCTSLPEETKASELEIEESKVSLLIYPDPATHDINIALSGFSNPSRVAVFNMVGQMMYTMEIKTYELDIITLPVSGFPAGTYFAVYSGNGIIKSEKFMVQH